MTQENEDMMVAYHVVCLLDVLGQKQKLARWARLPKDAKLTPELAGALQETAGVLLRFRENFTSFFEGLSKRPSPEELAGLPQEQQERHRRFKECRVQVERFSDTFVFSVPLFNSYGDASMVALYSLLVTCCHAVLTSLAVQAPVRGAITIGAGSRLTDGSFYGPALAEAHYLESKIANYPRVVVSPAVRQVLEEGQTYSHSPDMDRLMRQRARDCRQIIRQDVDDCWALDFLGEGIRSLKHSQETAAKLLKVAYAFVREQRDQFGQSGDTKLAGRYQLLQEYIESRGALWGLGEPTDGG